MPESICSTDSNSEHSPGQLAVRVRQASREGKLVPLEEAGQGSEAEFLAWKRTQETSTVDDIVSICELGQVYLYSELHMTRSYAQMLARAGCRDIRRAIVQTVRDESAAYPRPTPMESFRKPPFSFSAEALQQACEAILGNPEYADIHQIRASNGSVFLFSSTYMDPAHAASLADWLAADHLRNP